MPIPTALPSLGATKLGIKDLNSLHNINLQGLTAFKFRFRDHHAYPLTTSRCVYLPNHPLHELAKRRWNTRTDPLWWSCVARKEAWSSKRVVRSWLARRLRTAFIGSLRENGYDSDGWPLGGTKNEIALFGTAQLTPELPMMKINVDELQKQTDLAVLEMIRAQQRSGTLRIFKDRKKPGAMSKPMK